MKRAVGDFLNDVDIRNLLARRDGIVAHFEKLGEGAQYDRRSPELGCDVPQAAPASVELTHPGR